MIRCARSLQFGVVLSLLDVSVAGGPFDAWTIRNPVDENLPLHTEIYDILYAQDKFIAVGVHASTTNNQSAILYSSDGIKWSEAPAATIPGPFFAATYGDGKFVTVGINPYYGGLRDGLSPIFSSSDGLSWSDRTPRFAGNWSAIAYGNKMFVAAGTFTNSIVKGGALALSQDATFWTYLDASSFPPIDGIAFGNDTFVAVGGVAGIGDGPHAYTSSDAREWTTRDVPGADRFTCATFANGLFVLAAATTDLNASSGSSTLCKIFTSPDGIAWSERASNLLGRVERMAYGNGRFVGVGADPNPTLITSTNGINWTTQVIPNQKGFKSVAFGDGKFVAIGWPGYALTSIDGVNWHGLNEISQATLRSLAFGNDTFVAVGGEITGYAGGVRAILGPGVFLNSQDGVRWAEQRGLGEDMALSVTFGGGQFAAVAGSNIVVSPNGRDWERAKISNRDRFYKIIYGLGRFVAIGEQGAILTSTNGADWRRAVSGTTNLIDVAYGGGQFVASAAGPFAAYGIAVFVILVPGQGYVLTSLDAETWTPHVGQGNDPFFSIAYGNGRFVALGANANGVSVQISANGTDWDSIPRSDSPASPQKLRFLNGQFVVICWDGNVSTSVDGRHWSPPINLPPFSNGDLGDIVFGKNTCVAAGSNSRILQSGSENAVEVPIRFLVGRSSRPEDGVFRTGVESLPNRVFKVEVSDDLKLWKTLAIKTNTTGFIEVIDNQTGLVPAKFYRARLTP